MYKDADYIFKVYYGWRFSIYLLNPFFSAQSLETIRQPLLAKKTDSNDLPSLFFLITTCVLQNTATTACTRRLQRVKKIPKSIGTSLLSESAKPGSLEHRASPTVTRSYCARETHIGYLPEPTQTTGRPKRGHANLGNWKHAERVNRYQRKSRPRS